MLPDLALRASNPDLSTQESLFNCTLLLCFICVRTLDNQHPVLFHVVAGVVT